MEKEDLFSKRMQDLANSADKRGCVTFSDFLNLNEQNIYFQLIQKFSWIRGETFGGYEGSERRMAAFIPQDLLWESREDDLAVSPSGLVWPIRCVRIRPKAPKFSEKLSHRDILGALMNLGIDRAKTGDIAVTETESYLFCSARLTDLICEELTWIRHTQVVCSPCRMSDFSYTPATSRIEGSVASIRLDAVSALAFRASRSSLLPLIEGGKVFVNGKLVTSNGCTLHEGDIVSVRGMGRYKYLGAHGQTKKGRMIASVDKYI